jgi:DNA-binding response OmpR family regulator
MRVWGGARVTRRVHAPDRAENAEPAPYLDRATTLDFQWGVPEAKRSATMDPVAKILLAASGRPALEQLRSAVDGENATVLLASDGAEALARWWAEDPDVLVLEAALPTFSGFEVCRAIRQASETPVVIVTSASSDDLVVRGLGCGADDVVTPPLGNIVFRLRLRTVINRYRAARLERGAKNPPLVDATTGLTLGNLTIDAETRVVTDGTTGVRLTLREFRILELLVVNAGLTISFRRLFERAWGFPGDGAIQRVALRRYVMRMRKKLAPLGDQSIRIDSIRGLGYVAPRGS